MKNVYSLQKYSHQETSKKVKNTICSFFVRSRFPIPNSQPYRAVRHLFCHRGNAAF